MKIAVVDLVSVDGGGYHIAKSLYDYISEGKAANHEWLFIVSNQDFISNPYLRVIHIHDGAKNYLKRLKTELFDVNKELKNFGAQLVISMSNMAIPCCRINQLVYLQQSIPFQREKKFSFFKKKERHYAFRQYIQGALILLSLRKAKAILVQTNWLKDALERVNNNKTVLKIGYPRIEMECTKKVTEIKKDFFYPCGPEIYKNISIINEAVTVLKKEGYRFHFYLTITEDQFQELTDKRPDQELFICMGRVSHDTINDLYAKTTTVFASYIESLGLPLVEAKGFGTWIIASDCAFSHEVLDNYPNACFFDPFDVMDLVHSMKQVLNNEILLQQTEKEIYQVPNCWDVLMTFITSIQPMSNRYA